MPGIHTIHNAVQSVASSLQRFYASFFSGGVHTEASFDALVEAEIHAIDQIAHVVHKIFVYGSICRFQTKYILVFRFQGFQLGVEIFIFTLQQSNKQRLSLICQDRRQKMR